MFERKEQRSKNQLSDIQQSEKLKLLYTLTCQNIEQIRQSVKEQAKKEKSNIYEINQIFKPDNQAAIDIKFTVAWEVNDKSGKHIVIRIIVDENEVKY